LLSTLQSWVDFQTFESFGDLLWVRKYAQPDFESA